MTAEAEAGKLKVSYDYALSITDNHINACIEYLRKVNWTGNWHGGVFGHDMYWTAQSSYRANKHL